MKEDILDFICSVKEIVKNSKGNIKNINFDIIFYNLKTVKNIDEFLKSFSSSKGENFFETEKVYKVVTDKYSITLIYYEIKNNFTENIEAVEYSGNNNEFNLCLKQEKDGTQKVIEIWKELK